MAKQLSIGLRIKEARRIAGMTQEDLAGRLHCDPNTVSRYERGEGITLGLLQSLQRVLEQPVSYFLGETPSSAHNDMPMRSLLKEVGARYNSLELVEIPMLGAAPGGEPFVPEETATEFIKVEKSLVEGVQNPFAVRVVGRSLEGDGIHDGDMVIIDRYAPEVEGKLYLVQIGGTEATIKRLFRENDCIKLSSSNGTFEIMEKRRIEIKGRVVAWGHWTKAP